MPCSAFAIEPRRSPAHGATLGPGGDARRRQGQAGGDRRAEPSRLRLDRAGQDRRNAAANRRRRCELRAASARSSSGSPRSARFRARSSPATKASAEPAPRASTSSPASTSGSAAASSRSAAKLDAVAGMAGGEAFDQVAAVAAMIGGEREQRLGRGPGQDAGDLAFLHVEPILAEEGQPVRRFHDVDRDRHLVGRQLIVDVLWAR